MRTEMIWEQRRRKMPTSTSGTSGIQRLLPSQIVIGIDYSANRSTHLPWGGYSSTRNRDFISSSLLAQISAQQHALDPNCDMLDSCVSNYLQNTVTNPFCSLFGGGLNGPASCQFNAGPQFSTSLTPATATRRFRW